MTENRVSDSEIVSGELSKCGKHSNTAVLELSGSVPEDLLLADTSGETKRVKFGVFNISANKPLQLKKQQIKTSIKYNRTVLIS